MNRRYLGNLDREEQRVGKQKMYIVGRRDLPPGVMVAQIVHAAVEMALETDFAPPTVVILTVEDEAEILDLNRQLESRDEDTYVVLEPDLDHQFTAFSVILADPGPLAHLPLLFPDEPTEPAEEEKSA